MASQSDVRVSVSYADGCKPTGGAWAATDFDASPAYGVVSSALSGDARAVAESGGPKKIKHGLN